MPDTQMDSFRQTSRERSPLDAMMSGPAEACLPELYLLMLSSSRDCICLLDLDGHTLFISPGGIEGMAVSDVDAIIGLSWLRVWSGADLAAAQTAVATARAGGVGRFEGFCPTHEGTPKWWDVVISALPGSDGRPERLVTVGRDITARVRAQERLVVSEQMLRLATDAAEIGTWDLDVATRVLTRSDRAAAMLGLPPAEYKVATFCDGLHPDDRAATGAALEAAMDPARRTPYDVEFRFCKNGKTFWFADTGRAQFDAAGRCLRVTGVLIDITARKVAEEERRCSEARLRELNATLEARVTERTRELDRAWNNSLVLQVVCDAAGVYRVVNDAWTRILGWSSAEIIGTRSSDMVHPDDRGRTAAALVTASRETLGAHEVRYRHKDGGYRWISWLAAPQDDLIYATGRHITAEKEAAAELEATQEKLRQSMKMEAVGQLTGGLAHDFNNLLTGISGSLEMLQTRVAQGRLDTIDRFITTAQGAAKRAAALTQRLLAFSRRQTLDPRPTDVNRLVAGMEDLVRRTVGPNVAIQVINAEDPWPALVDANQLENALLNLCINARDAMPDGGRLTIETENKWLEAGYAAEQDLPEGRYISLCVSDTGTGMTQAVAARAFDPFFTTKPLGQGTGLGLSMIYGFARQSGGHVRICSELGRGTNVCLYLPRHGGLLEEALAPTPPPGAAPARRGETVLVVDDEPALRMLIVEVLEDAGYSAIEAEDGPAGLAILQSGARIDLLVTDVGLPGGMNGRQVADAGRALRPGLKVLFITGYAENAVIGNGGLEQGMQILTKPFGLEMFGGKIRALIEG